MQTSESHMKQAHKREKGREKIQGLFKKFLTSTSLFYPTNSFGQLDLHNFTMITNLYTYKQQDKPPSQAPQET